MGLPGVDACGGGHQTTGKPADLLTERLAIPRSAGAVRFHRVGGQRASGSVRSGRRDGVGGPIDRRSRSLSRAGRGRGLAARSSPDNSK